MAGERGQILPLGVLVVLLAVLAALAVAHLGARAHTLALAQTAADAAALAGAVGGEAAAHTLAAANGAELVGFAVVGAPEVADAGGASVVRATVRATVRIGDVEAEAWAGSPSGGLTAPPGAARGRCRATDGRPIHFVPCPASPPP